MDTVNLILEFTKALAWPMVVLILLFRFKPAVDNILSQLSGRLKSVKKLQLFGQEVELLDFERNLEKEVKNLENALANIFPPEKSNRYMPLLAEPEVAYYVHAVEFLDRINVDVKNLAAWNAVGHYYFPIDREKSRRCYERAIEINPEDPNAHANLGIWYLLHSRDLYMAKEEFESSIQFADKQKLICPWAYVGLGAVYRRLRDPEQERPIVERAKTQFNDSVSRDKTDYWAYYGLGWCWARGNANIEKAIEYTKQALTLRPDFTTARYNLACHKAENNDAKGSVEELKKLLEPTKLMLQILDIEHDDDFKSISDSEEFLDFIEMLGLKYQLGTTK